MRRRKGIVLAAVLVAAACGLGACGAAPSVSPSKPASTPPTETLFVVIRDGIVASQILADGQIPVDSLAAGRSVTVYNGDGTVIATAPSFDGAGPEWTQTALGFAEPIYVGYIPVPREPFYRVSLDAGSLTQSVTFSLRQLQAQQWKVTFVVS